MPSNRFEMDVALRRLLVGLERPADLNQWRRRPLDHPSAELTYVLDLPVQPVLLIHDAGREKQRAQRPIIPAVAEAQAPQPVDVDGSVGLALPLAAEPSIRGERVAAPIAELAAKDV